MSYEKIITQHRNSKLLPSHSSDNVTEKKTLWMQQKKAQKYQEYWKIIIILSTNTYTL